jgi:hypothetical protein
MAAPCRFSEALPEAMMATAAFPRFTDGILACAVLHVACRSRASNAVFYGLGGASMCQHCIVLLVSMLQGSFARSVAMLMLRVACCSLYPKCCMKVSRDAVSTLHTQPIAVQTLLPTRMRASSCKLAQHLHKDTGARTFRARVCAQAPQR